MSSRLCPLVGSEVMAFGLWKPALDPYRALYYKGGLGTDVNIGDPSGSVQPEPLRRDWASFPPVEAGLSFPSHLFFQSMTVVEGWGLRSSGLYTSPEGAGLAWGKSESRSLAFKFFFLICVPLVSSRSSTPPFSSEEEPEEDVVQRVSLQPPKVLSRSAPQPEDNWGWSDSETSEESAQPSDKGSGGLASSGESFSGLSFSMSWKTLHLLPGSFDLAFLLWFRNATKKLDLGKSYFAPCFCL